MEVSVGKKRGKPLWTISKWASDADKRAEILLTLLVVVLVVALFWRPG